MQKCEAISFKVVGILLFVRAITRPFIKILSVSTNIVVRMLGFDPNADEEVVTEEEIRMLVDAGEEKGVIEESQKEMINNIFDFDDVPVSDVMTHRTEIEAVEITDKIEDVVKLSCENGYSRIPVYEDELDNIRGIIYVKDLLPYVGKNIPNGKTISKFMRDAEFVPESKRCGDLFTEMTEKRVQMMFVSDEYGAVSGLVTIEDLLESIVGNIQDEYDEESVYIKENGTDEYVIQGMMPLEDLGKKLGIDFEEEPFDTVNGFIISRLEHIPEEGEEFEFEFEGYQFRILEVKDMMIQSVAAQKIVEQTGEMEKEGNTVEEEPQK